MLMRHILTAALILFAGTLTGQAPQWICLPDSVTVYPMDNINTPSIEFAPAYYGAGLVFVMARENMRFIDPSTGRAYFDLMFTELGPDGKGTRPVNFSPNIRTQYHEGPCAFSADGREIFFTRSNVSGGQGVPGKKGEVQLQIFQGVRGEADWENIRPLPFNSDAYSIAHPALSPDGRFLVFTSNMPGGLGGMDLYIVPRDTASWGVPVNLGPGINSKGNEAFAVWHPAGYLVYASDGMGGLGGLDLFIARVEADGMIGQVQHLPAPFNSKRDDLGLILDAEGTSGYLASSRKPGKGKDDLYGWRSATSVFCAPTPNVPLLAERELLVVDVNGKPIENAYTWLMPMSGERKAQFDEHFATRLVPDPQDPEKFLFEWTMADSLSYATASATSASDGRLVLSADPNASYALAVQADGYQPVVLMVNGDRLPDRIVLGRLAATATTCRTVNFLVSDDTGTMPLGDARIAVTGECAGTGLAIRTKDNGKGVLCVPTGCPLQVEVSREGYAPHTFMLSAIEEQDNWKVMLRPAGGLTGPAAPIASGTVIVLNNIYYDFNKSEIRKGDAAELISLANVMKQYPDLRIEMTAHTDTRGSAEYNLELSRRRVESARQYLVLLGIGADRITVSAAGESQPRNHCLDGVSCTEAEHQYNRRTEVRIINPAQGMEVRYPRNE